MRAITLTQPWASLVIAGIKQIETRGWTTQHRGPLVIHAAKRLDRYGHELLDELVDLGPDLAELRTRIVRDDLFGVALGVVQLVNIVSSEEALAAIRRRQLGVGFTGNQKRLARLEEQFGDYSPGRFGWLLDRPEPFEYPIEVRGALGLWTYDGSVPLP